MLSLEIAGWRRFLGISLALYVVLGFWGSLWLADEFDWERTIVTSYLGVPVAMLFLCLSVLVPAWWSRYPLSLRCLAGSLLLCFAWGNLMLLNALGGDAEEIVDIEAKQQALDIAYKRGGFDWLYRERF